MSGTWTTGGTAAPEGHGLSDAEPWPEWKVPPAREVEPRSAGAAAFVDDAAFQLGNLRAGIAQATAIVPFVGPAVAFAANKRGSFARREAAKAFNGQATTLVLLPATVALSFGLYSAIDELGNGAWFPFSAFFGTVVLVAVLLGGSVLHAIAGMLLALRGIDWTSPLTRIMRVQILPEGEPDPIRRRR